MSNIFSFLRRRTVRSHINPMDICTIVSIYPKHIIEKKPTIQPGRFEIPLGRPDNPSVLLVGPSSWWREIDESQPLFEVVNSSIQVASALVNDYSNGILGCNMSDARPGLFFIEGAVSLDDVRTKYKGQLLAANVKQVKFFNNLVKIADTGWARSNGNPLCINDDMRLAATELGLKNKDWMQDHQNAEMIRCMACGSMRNPLFPMCSNCKTIIDHDLAKKIGLTSADIKTA